MEEEADEEEDATASASLHIKNFTRPLQLKEVTDLLSENGTLVEGADGFWMDRQKRRCCCTVCSLALCVGAFASQCMYFRLCCR